MSIKLIKNLTFTVGASLIALSSINVAHAYPNLCTRVGGTSVGAPTACADCHTGANPSAGNYTGGCTSMAPPPPPAPAPAPAPAPTPTPTPTPTPGGNAGNTGGGAHGMGHRRDDMHRKMRGDDDDRGRFGRHGRDD